MASFSWNPISPTIMGTNMFKVVLPNDQIPYMNDSSYRHPEGGHVFYHESIIAPHPITEDHISAANQALGRLGGDKEDVTLVMYASEMEIYYYCVSHSSKRISWIDDQVSLSDDDVASRHLDFQYWTHMRNFPEPQHLASDHITALALKQALLNASLHAMTPRRGNSRPFVEPWFIRSGWDKLRLIESTNDLRYKVYNIAVLWITMVLNGTFELQRHRAMDSPIIAPSEVENAFNGWLKIQAIVEDEDNLEEDVRSVGI